MVAQLPETADFASVDLRATRGTWSLACVKSREEKAIAGRLDAAGITVFLPTVIERRIYRRKAVELEVAFAPGYMFVAWERDEQYGTALCTRGVFELLPDVRQDRMVKQMEDLQRAIASPNYQGNDEWQKGRPCRIKPGHNLAGVVGWLTKRRETTLVQVGYPLMGYVAEVEVDHVFIELL